MASRRPPDDPAPVQHLVELRQATLLPGYVRMPPSHYVERQDATELLADRAGGVGYLLKDRVGELV
jgi:hypothetical protein